MKLSFTKMHGCGNNYIYINCFDQKVTDPEKLSIALSEPHFGIGGDGIILISPSDRADAQMRIFNADGSEGKMCGNGIRCVGKYLYDNGMVGGRTTITIDTLSGVKTLELNVRDGKMQTARVDMGAAILEPAKIPVNMAGSSVIDAPLVVDEKVYHVTCVSMGNPHCVIFFNEDDVDDLDLSRLGPKFEHHPLFPERINTEFVNVLPDGSLNRPYLGEQVFSREERLARLNEIVYAAIVPAVRARVESGESALWAIDAINLLESGMARLCDRTVAVTSPMELRLRRIMARDGIDEGYARLRIGAQRTDDYYREHCDLELCNDAAAPEEFEEKAKRFF